MNKKSLYTALENKSTALREKQTKQSAAAVAFIAASEEATVTAKTAADHASAVEQALSILANAGVVL